MSLSLRYAIADDIPHMIPLFDQLGYPVEAKDLEHRFNIFTQKEDCGLCVAVTESTVVGWIAWSKTPCFVSGKVKFRIEGLVVGHAYRRRGVGQKLMQFVENIASQSAPSVIDLTSGLRRAQEGTHLFYKNLGYQNEGFMAKLYLRKEISSPL